MKVHKVQAYKAFATSAMREAYNGKEVVELIKEKADINIEIIDGKGGGDYCFNRFASFVKTDETCRCWWSGVLFSNSKIVT
jgi:exopolyphosphatase/guanosine-5'-triphosphate,3'-diphosphate pyrophosphatase